MKFRICLLSIFCCLLSAAQVDAGQNSNAVISLDYVASGQGNRIDDGVMSGTVSGRGTTIVVEVFAKNVSTSLIAVEILFKSSSALTYVGAENPKTFVPVNLSNGVALTFANPLIPLANGDVFLAKAQFTTLVDVSNSEFKIGIEKVKLVENINNFDEITSSNEIVFNRSSTTNTPNTFQIVWPMDGDINYDGQVNFPDFLLLVDNFGKTGVVPTSRMAIENALATGGSGTVITIRDTIYQTRTIRDTVRINVSTGRAPLATKKLGIIRISLVGQGQRNWDSDAEDDGLQCEVWFYDEDDNYTLVPAIYKIKFTLYKDNDNDDEPDLPHLWSENLTDVIIERHNLTIRIPKEKYNVVTSGPSADRRDGIAKVELDTSEGKFSDINSRYTIELYKPVIPKNE